MSLVSLAVVAILFTVGTYLVLQRMLSRVIIGLGLISHGANLFIMLSGSGPAAPPVLAEGVAVESVADPLPQAMVLTAIGGCIGLAISYAICAAFPVDLEEFVGIPTLSPAVAMMTAAVVGLAAGMPAPARGRSPLADPSVAPAARHGIANQPRRLDHFSSTRRRSFSITA